MVDVPKNKNKTKPNKTKTKTEKRSYTSIYVIEEVFPYRCWQKCSSITGNIAF